MRIPRFVRTGLDTSSASNAFMVCNHHNATIFEVTCTGRAATNARRVITMVATLRTQFNTYVRIGSVYSFGYAVASKADRYIILGLAGDYTVAAANTFFSVNSHCVPHASASFRGSTVKNVIKFPLIPVPPIMGSNMTFVINSVSFTPLP